ncbi:MAG: hypothetical protein BWY21_00328 [Parcubacteria group bacterium ADurb.Bin216]|nr:MAG: hypothetical protein BWY21_00328 [Parcubacteria group bacterium ADurb.Bin216]
MSTRKPRTWYVSILKGNPRYFFSSERNAWSQITTDYWRTKELAKKAGWEVIKVEERTSASLEKGKEDE